MEAFGIRETLIKLINRTSSILPVFFWIFLIFGFEEPSVAIMSIAAALLHEAGHIIYISIRQKTVNLRGVISGLRIKKKELTTYREELFTYISGPLANLIAFTLLSLLAPMIGEWAREASVINLVTALSNLIPIEGYDGYGILRCILDSRYSDNRLLSLTKHISTALTFLFCIFSLYLIDRLGGGYWIFAVFFISTIKYIKDELDK